MKIGIGSDHAGYQLKERVLKEVSLAGMEWVDIGCETDQVKSSHVLTAEEMSRLVLAGDLDLGILVCGTGIGMSLVANRHPGIRAAVANDVYSAIKSKEHNHANILCIGARVLGVEQAELVIESWLQTTPDQAYQEIVESLDR
ncbi:RpiB/LacA/LacB family sugar-phosphate isomerase [Vagococcus sp. BWB3-3]|uniref:RpiB/LacA/LacB family sugar-phosphate isomerase n=1 Tax=Vagococcus allomyrinae TaxID=2794353 RepID=A0A940P602_9ENTE|nr:RpiB/LacA/LacB family sugar-phosphate isomerase [Vagococcus allomyrinae]MBP1042244.1 RpiB/LacA/LacB family sugar-phosphate isomerase [Vagococcus allomyrinae]